MKSKILVAGGGHGGIAAGALLAKEGFDVTVVERNTRDEMGHDWTDIFDKRAFTVCGMPLPDKEKYNLKSNMTFFPPSGRKPITQETEFDKLEIQMERKDIYSHIISYAEECGVKFEFGTDVQGPVFSGSRVVGIKTAKGEMFADLVIDACGIDSPVRRAMPYYTGIQKKPGKGEQFFVYRAFYERTAPIPDDNFRVLLFHGNKLGISWVATEEEHTDVLIGRFEPFDMNEVDRVLESLRKTESSLGEKKLRGGQFVKIPVRQPLGILVADGYAAIGDSAFMTVPLIGSGIANSMKAAKILADAVKADTGREFSATTLWKYQKDFYRQLGAGLAPIACIRSALTKMSPEDIDYIFDNEVLLGKETTMDCDSNSILAFASHIDITTLPHKIRSFAGRPQLMKTAIKCGKMLAEAMAVSAAVPQQYDRKKLLKWVSTYDNIFT